MKIWKIFLALCLAVTMTLSLVACSGSPEPGASTDPGSQTTGETEEPASTLPADGSEVGEGQHSFTFQAKMVDGTEYTYTVHTDEETVGAALLALGFIDGEESSYGLYVTTVLGTTLDYDADGYYWLISENGTSSSVGVDSISIQDGSTYAFTATAA